MLFVQDVASDDERPKYADEDHDINHEDDSVVAEPAYRSLSPTPPSQEVIDVDEVEEQYYLKEFKQWLPRAEVEQRLRAKYVLVFRRQAKQAMPNTQLKQRLEEIVSCARDPSRSIRYIVGRDESTWRKKLRDARNAIQAEHDGVVKFHDDTLRRAEYKQVLGECLIARTRARLRVAGKDLLLRTKIINEMAKWIQDE